VKESRAYLDTPKRLRAGIGAKAPVPSGFRLADAQSQTGLARCMNIALHPFQLWIISPIQKQN